MKNIQESSLKMSTFKIAVDLSSESPLKKSLMPASDIRGSLVTQSRRMFCVKTTGNEDCENCSLRYKCNFAQLYRTPLPKDSTVMRKYKEVPHPFALAAVTKEESFEIIVTLFGDYIDYFPFIFLALQEVGKRKKFEVISAENESTPIFSNGNLSTDFGKVPVSDIAKNLQVGELTVTLISPLRIKQNEKLVNPTTFSFEALVENIMRRFSLLSYFYNNEKPDVNFEEIFEQASRVPITSGDLKWLELERYSTRTKQTSPMGGIVGSFSVNVQDEALAFLLFLGQKTQVGKNTSFGYGYYEIKKNKED